MGCDKSEKQSETHKIVRVVAIQRAADKADAEPVSLQPKVAARGLS